MRAWRQPLVLLAIAVLAAACSGPTSDASAGEPNRSEQTVDEPMKIRIIAADQTFTAVLDDSEAARDFAALLPIELTLSDYNRTEKIADLPRALSTAGAPEGVAPVAGDFAYYCFALNTNRQPGGDRVTRRLCDFERHRPTGLLLDDD